MKKLLLKLLKKRKKLVFPMKGSIMDDLSKIQKVDKRLNTLASRAKNGSITAQYDLYLAFAGGEGTKKNLDAASYFLLLALNTLGLDLENSDNVLQYLHLLVEFGVLEKERGDYESMKVAFSQAVSFMHKYIDIQHWDYAVFRTMEECLQDQNIK